MNHGASDYARDDDGDEFCEVHVNIMEDFWPLHRSWIRIYRGISKEHFLFTSDSLSSFIMLVNMKIPCFTR